MSFSVSSVLWFLYVVVARPFIWLVFLHVPSGCCHVPTCSAYARAAWQRDHWRAVPLIARRVLCCVNLWGKREWRYDPLPPRPNHPHATTHALPHASPKEPPAP